MTECFIGKQLSRNNGAAALLPRKKLESRNNRPERASQKPCQKSTLGALLRLGYATATEKLTFASVRLQSTTRYELNAAVPSFFRLTLESQVCQALARLGVTRFQMKVDDGPTILGNITHLLTDFFYLINDCTPTGRPLFWIEQLNSF
jgi:hypothetical protein